MDQVNGGWPLPTALLPPSPSPASALTCTRMRGLCGEGKGTL